MEVGKDSLSVEAYLATSEPIAMYAALQEIFKDRNIAQMNMVSNSSSDLTALAERIPLYSYILLDERKGTDSGVQVTVENGRVKSIYLNSGKKLSRWPESGSAKETIREGDAAEQLYGKFSEIKGRKSYAKKFERISLATKDMTKPFDPEMGRLPQWYFGYSTGDRTMEQVGVYLVNGKGSHVVVTKYKQW
ncbi:hypothetical protein GCM10023091_07220 [Ravibacter arvi]|uniref:FTP domain-containing protein n=2 Tax=Ravibacter arvi TaxID=2051041 RepID=A0ABP8LS86_9BACT